MAGDLNLSQMRELYGKYSLLCLTRELLFFLITASIAFDGDTITLTARGRYYRLIKMPGFFSTAEGYQDRCISANG
jgi:hypothetical protein